MEAAVSTAPATGAAPAAPATSAPAPASVGGGTSTSAGSSSPAGAPAAGGTSSGAAETPAVGKSEPQQLPDSAIEPLDEKPAFDWDAWDGKVEALPDEHREIGSRFEKFYSSRYKDYDQFKSENERLTRLYNLAIENLGDDPRVAELTTERDRLKSDLEAATKQFSDLDAQVKSYREREAKEYSDRIAREHPAYFSDAAAKAKLKSMFDKGWQDPEIAIQLLDLGDDAVAAAEELKADGATEIAALKYAQAKVSGPAKRPQPSDAARITAGAPGSNTRRGPPTAETSKSLDQMTHSEAVKAVARRLVKKG